MILCVYPIIRLSPQQQVACTGLIRHKTSAAALKTSVPTEVKTFEICYEYNCKLCISDPKFEENENGYSLDECLKLQYLLKRVYGHLIDRESLSALASTSSSESGEFERECHQWSSGWDLSLQFLPTQIHKQTEML